MSFLVRLKKRAIPGLPGGSINDQGNRSIYFRKKRTPMGRRGVKGALLGHSCHALLAVEVFQGDDHSLKGPPSSGRFWKC